MNKDCFYQLDCGTYMYCAKSEEEIFDAIKELSAEEKSRVKYYGKRQQHIRKMRPLTKFVKSMPGKKYVKKTMNKLLL